MMDENVVDENEGNIEIPSRINPNKADSENEEMNLSDEEEVVNQAMPIPQNIILKEEKELKDFAPVEKTDRNKLKFSYLTKFFQKYSELKGRKKAEFMTTFLTDYLFKHDRTNAFSVLRLMLPEQDRERNTYGLKETNLGKLLAEAFSLPVSEANRLKYFKNPNYQPFGAPVGDFSNVAYSVLKGLCKPESVITVGEVNDCLDKLASLDDNKERVKVMIKIIKQCSGEDLRWICKIILKELKIGLKFEKVLTNYHPEALDLYNLTSNLREVCKEFVDLKHTLSNVLRLFYPVKPMLAGKRKMDEIKHLLFGKSINIEIKYDGERIQCHFNREQLKFYTRNSNDYTHIYGPKLGDVIRQHVKAQSVILDGEVVVVNKFTGQVEPFGANKSVAQNDAESDLQLCYKVFDILYVKSEQGEECNLMGLKLVDRKKVLKRILVPERFLIEVGESHETTNLEEIGTFFEKAIARNEEGIIIKQSDSFYVPHERSTSWIKLKGDYVDGIADTLDVLVIGGYYGEGKARIGKFGDSIEHLTSFLLAISKKIDKENPSNSLFIPFCKVGTGYRVFELESLRTKIKPHLIKYDPKIKPRYIVNWNPTVSDKPDYIIDSPNNSIILEIKAAEFIKTTSFPCDYTLRFPRVIKIRYDKDWHECMTYEEMMKMLYDSEKALRNIKKKARKNSGHSDHGAEEEKNDGDEAPKKRVKTARELSVLAQYKDTDVSAVNVVSELFKNCEFYIVNNDSNFVSKSFLEEQIVKYGGTKVQNFLFTNTHIIASYSDFKLEAILNKYPCNILYPKWITDSIKNNKLQDFAPKYLLHCVPWLQKRNEELYDVYGDSFVIDTNAATLKEFILDMKIESDIFEIDDDLKHIKKKLKDKIILETPVFEDITVFILSKENDFQRKLLKFKLVYNGAKTTENASGTIDYILEDRYSIELSDELKNYRQNHKNTRVVNEAFFLDIIEKTEKSKFY